MGNDREENVLPGEVSTHRDFAEQLSLQFNSQAQHEYFGGGATVSLEGVSVQGFQQEDGKKVMQFHSFFSDSKQQDCHVVHNHNEKLIQHLLDEGLLKKGHAILCQTDGCSDQCRSATSACLNSAMAFGKGIVINRMIGESTQQSTVHPFNFQMTLNNQH